MSKLLSRKGKSLQLIFSANELSLRTQQIAGNFSAKEAIIKAFTKVCKLKFSQIEIKRDVAGRLFVEISKTFPIKNVSIDFSISNKSDLVVAVAIVQIN